MKLHQNSPSLSLSPPPCCKCSNQDSKQLIVSRLRDRERELVCQGLQNLPSKRGAFEEFHCIPQRPWRGDVPWFALAGACPKILKTLSHTALFRFSSSSHSLQTAARPSSQLGWRARIFRKACPRGMPPAKACPVPLGGMPGHGKFTVTLKYIYICFLQFSGKKRN